MLSAWVDESASNQVLDPGSYLLAAAVTFDEHLDALRDGMVRLRLKGAHKVHWHDDDDERHRVVIAALAAMEFEAVVVARTAPGDRAEHSRRKCLERLLHEMHAVGCPQVTLESRGKADDARDRQILEYLRRQQRPAGKTRMYHDVGPKEPLLGIADAVCGALTRHRTGDPSYIYPIPSRITVIECD